MNWTKSRPTLPDMVHQQPVESLGHVGAAIATCHRRVFALQKSSFILQNSKRSIIDGFLMKRSIIDEFIMKRSIIDGFLMKRSIIDGFLMGSINEWEMTELSLFFLVTILFWLTCTFRFTEVWYKLKNAIILTPGIQMLSTAHKQ